MYLREKIFRHIDFVLLLCVTFLVTVSVVFIYSSKVNSEGILTSDIYIRQIIWGCAGLVFMTGISFLDYKKYSRYVPYIFGFFIGLLVLLIVLKFVDKIVFKKPSLYKFANKGAHSWLGFGFLRFQPSEFCKIAFIMFLAWFLDSSKTMNKELRTGISIAIMAIPCGLILIQPDFGTAFIYIPIFFVMCFVGGIPVRYLAWLFTTGVLIILFTFIPLWQNISKSHSLIASIYNSRVFSRVMFGVSLNLLFLIIGSLFIWYYKPESRNIAYWVVYVTSILLVSIIGAYLFPKFLDDYQVQRLIIFIDPEVDPLGTGWNIRNSKIAIGSGSLWGKGFLAGSQSHLQYLPEQSTDFIFSIISEEMGFFGGLGLFTVYFIMLLRMIYIIKQTINDYGYYIGVGIVSLLFFHFIINVGMVMGIMPVTGIPLLFLSYGGSSMLTAMICAGIMMSIRAYKFEF